MCEICAYADKHGSWPPDHRGTHCRDCHASWTGTAKAHCVTCHETFRTTATADLHRYRDGGHVHPSELRPGILRVVDGLWIRVYGDDEVERRQKNIGR